MRDPERYESNNQVERRIAPLVEALNECEYTRTFGSCQGHFGFEEPELFNKKAYVEFRMPRDKFREIERIIHQNMSVNDCQVEFDDYLPNDAYFYGSLYIIPDRSLKYKEQRRAADEMINKIARIIQSAWRRRSCKSGSRALLPLDRRGRSVLCQQRRR